MSNVKSSNERIFRLLRIRFTLIVSLFSLAVITSSVLVFCISSSTFTTTQIGSVLDDATTHRTLNMVISEDYDNLSEQNAASCMYIILYRQNGVVNVHRVNFDIINTDSYSDAALIEESVMSGETSFAVSERQYSVKRASTISSGKSGIISVYAIYDATEMLDGLSFGITFSIFIGIMIFLASVVGIYFLSGYFLKPAKQSMDKQKELIANASHELKTPLTIINANMEVMLSDKNVSIKENEKWLNNMLQQTDKMNELVSEMLELATLDSGATEIIYEHCDVTALAESIILSFEAPLFEKGIEITYEAEENVTGKLFRSGFSKVVGILTENAMKYSGMGDKIETELWTAKRELCFSVSNPGEIGEEDLNNIFNRFYRTKEAKAENSYGLGLAMAKTLVAEMKGKIDVASENGKVTFTVTVPFVKENEHGI